MLGAKLAALLGSPESRPDFVALDLKTSPRRYRDFSGAIPDPESELFRSIGLVSGLPPESREFRTVLVPGLVGLREITEIAALIPKDAAWFFAPFRNQGCLDPAYNDVPPYSDGEAQDLVSAAAALIPGARLR
jgi:pyruvate formate lyase activating enzyme